MRESRWTRSFQEKGIAYANTLALKNLVYLGIAAYFSNDERECMEISME